MKKLLLAPLLLLAACGGDNSATQTQGSVESEAPVPPAPPAPVPAFNVPALFGMSATQIKSLIGKPTMEDKLTDRQRQMDFPIDAEFKRDTTTLTISYSPKTDKVATFNISFPNPVKDVSLLYKAGGVERGGDGYTTKVFPVVIHPELIASLAITPSK